MNVDIGNALDGDLGLARADLDALDDRVGDAHERIERGRAEAEHGYAALNLPETCDPEPIRRAASGFDPDHLLTVGIGGSALGAATLTDALGSGVDCRYLDNVDPAWVRATLDDVALSNTVVNVVSRSGTTAETLSNFLVVRRAMESAGVDWTERTVVTTGGEGNLRAMADEHDLPALDVPEGVPGRFSALSTVGLFAAAVAGVDLDELLAGAAAEADRLAGSLFESPAYAYGATAYALAERGAATNAVMPYAESLERFAEWFAQLWAESLGKDGGGQTPARALGATDQHSQLQLYRAGPADKLVTLVRPRGSADTPIPETDLEGLSYLGGSSLGELLDAEFRATEASLAAAGRENVRIEIDRVDERGIGELLYGMEAACVLYGELAGVSTFTQPAVEWGKKAARGLLGGGDFAEADAVSEKRRLEVE
ncbi:glucose-6-phosphate isomerase [Halobaculum gomorrense]|uniref:Probable glucose-6-phosphate isomerase n=1 Tax=Halobaculum gomorrense TaxID=43928 RepID=A0A1M5M0A5_9EURY|nr:glucose-6-phosphate isomerase [Halobaculum gomorrense]SHG70711.1 glucose-6-phosphate isomerase [Halobaculum gomorrense]